MLVAVKRPSLKLEPEWPLPVLFTLTVLTSKAAGGAGYRSGGRGDWRRGWGCLREGRDGQENGEDGQRSDEGRISAGLGEPVGGSRQCLILQPVFFIHTRKTIAQNGQNRVRQDSIRPNEAC